MRLITTLSIFSMSLLVSAGEMEQVGQTEVPKPDQVAQTEVPKPDQVAQEEKPMEQTETQKPDQVAQVEKPMEQVDVPKPDQKEACTLTLFKQSHFRGKQTVYNGPMALDLAPTTEKGPRYMSLKLSRNASLILSSEKCGSQKLRQGKRVRRLRGCAKNFTSMELLCEKK